MSKYEHVFCVSFKSCVRLYSLQLMHLILFDSQLMEKMWALEGVVYKQLKLTKRNKQEYI